MKSFFGVILFLFTFSPLFSQSDRDFLLSVEHKSHTELKALKKQLKRTLSTPVSKNELKIKVIDFNLKLEQDDILERFELLIQISQNTEPENEEFVTWAYYHLGANLSYYKLNDLAIEENKNCLRLAKKIDNPWMIGMAYSNIASDYFSLKDFSNAKKNFLLCGKSTYDWPDYFFASNFNNLGLCDHLSKNYWKAIENYQKGLQFLEKDNVVNPGVEKDVYYLISGNLGSSYIRVKEYELALTYLSKELNYYKENKIDGFNYTTCLIDFVRLNKRMNSTEKMLSNINLVLESIQKNHTANEKLQCIEKLLHALEEEKIQFDETRINKLYNQILIQVNQENNRIQRELTKLLYEDKIESLVKNEEYARNNFELEKKNQKLTIYSGLGAILLLIIVIFLVLRNNKRKLQQTELALLVQKQKEEITRNQQTILEQQVNHQKEQLNSMFTNLSIKQRTENGFLEKIKELKRNKNASPEVIFKELQLALNNLLDIDKKLNVESRNHVDISQELIDRIKEKLPMLTNEEIIMSTYFISDLSSKEIGLLMHLSDVSVRVAKNKIKNKIGLGKDESLDKYLKSIAI